MDTEASIYGKGGKPPATVNGDYSVPEGRQTAEPEDLDDPGAMDEEDTEADPPPITR
jgi:hypothetical protein